MIVEAVVAPEWYRRVPTGLSDEIVDMVDRISFPIEGDDVLSVVNHVVAVLYFLDLMQHESYP